MKWLLRPYANFRELSCLTSSLLSCSFCSYFMLFSFNFPTKLCNFSLPRHSFHQGARFFHGLFQLKQRAAIASVRHWATRLTKTLIEIFYCFGDNTVSFSVSARRKKKGLLQYNILLAEFLYKNLPITLLPDLTGANRLLLSFSESQNHTLWKLLWWHPKN